MSVDWEVRRTNMRVLLAVKGMTPTAAARATEPPLSDNTVSQFLSGIKPRLSEDSLLKLLPVLGISASTDLDAANILDDPRRQIRQILDRVPDTDLPELLADLQQRFPDTD